MDGIQKAIEQKLFAIPELALGQLLRKKLKQHGIDVSDDQGKQFAKDAMSGKSRFEIPHLGDALIDIEITKEESEDLISKIDRRSEERRVGKEGRSRASR